MDTIEQVDLLTDVTLSSEERISMTGNEFPLDLVPV